MTTHDPLTPPGAAYLSHWDDYGHIEERKSWACDRQPEFCHRCGRQMVETIEPTDQMSRRTGELTFARWHSCPTWVEGWRTAGWARWFALPGYGHDSHDAENPLSSRGYR